MIVTLTPNPSVDRTLEVPVLERGAVVRASASRTHPGGKGVNVSRALAANGVSTRAVLPAGGREGDQLLDLLDGLGIEVVGVPIAGAVRANVTVAEADGTVTKLNAPGPHLSVDESSSLVKAIIAASADASWIAVCGSLPSGADPQFARVVVEALHEAGMRVAVDSSGPAFSAALEAGPELVKPNAEELAEAVGRRLRTVGHVVAAARELVDRGVGAALVTLGSAGAVLVTPTATHRAVAPAEVPRSTVGAGDATLAGFLACEAGSEEALRWGVAWGAAAVRLPGTQMPGPGDVRLDEVRLVDLDEGESLEGREGA